MYIFVCSDILDAACDENEKKHQNAVQTLLELALASARGHHYVYVDKLNDDKYRKLSNFLVERLKPALENGRKRTGGSLIEKLQLIAIVTYNADNIDEWKTRFAKNKLEILHINPQEDIITFELSEETHVITENLYDSVFYHQIALRKLKMLGLSGLNLSFLPRNGGGMTTAKVYEQELKAKNHFCLLITDSDKCHPKDKEGVTANSARELHDNSDYKYSDLYVMSRVMEVENLIPNKFLDRTNGKEELLKFDLSFFDIKHGITVGRLSHKLSYKYWKGILGANRIDKTYEEYSDENNYPDKKTPIVSGWGSNTLTDFLSKNENLKALCNIKDNSLSNAQRFEWDNISSLFVNWCIASKKVRL